MATSGTTNWSLNRDSLITAALRKLAVLPSGGTASSAQISDAAVALNAIIKAFQADGLQLWKTTSYDFTTVAGTATYSIGTGETLDTDKPLRVIEAFYTLSGGNNTPLEVKNRYDFYILPQSSSITGTPVKLYYQPLRETGVISLWPTPVDSTTTITIHYQSQIEDMDASTDDFDFPSYWMNALIYNLAWNLAPEYGIPPQDRQMLQAEANYWHQMALSMDTEEGGIFIQPDWFSGRG